MMHATPAADSGERSVRTGIALAAIHLGACAAAIPALFTWSGACVAFVLYYLTGAIGICLGYHQLLTHRSFRVPRIVEYAIATCGALALQGGPIEWIATHRAHHAYSDTERDPHDSHRGFFWSHVAWLYRRNPARLTPEQQRRFAPDLVGDPYYRFLEFGTPVLQIILGALLFAFGGWSWVVWGIFLRLVVTYHATWLVNSAPHLSGYRSFKTPGRDRSTNNRWVALFAWGEGWHNNHHAFPSSARHGLRSTEVDVTWWTIEGLAFLRIASGISTPDSETMRRAERSR